MPDPQAENAIRSSMKSLAAQGIPLNRQTVPDAAREALLTTGASKTNVPERIDAAIVEMVKRGELTAPSEPWVDWSST